MAMRDQVWAQRASARVSARQPEPWGKKYGIQCLHLPAMIHQCGLCQALTFLEAKAKDEHLALLDDLAAALGFGTRAVLVDRARSSALTAYQQMSREALGCSNYFKRYAEAIIRVELGVDPVDPVEAVKY
jgi:CRISPR-associated protein Cmr5